MPEKTPFEIRRTGEDNKYVVVTPDATYDIAIESIGSTWIQDVGFDRYNLVRCIEDNITCEQVSQWFGRELDHTCMQQSVNRVVMVTHERYSN